MSDKSEHRALPVWLLAGFSWAVSLYCAIDLVHNVSWFPENSAVPKHAIPLFLLLFFLFLPFFTRIKIGKFLELEREVQKAKEEVQDFKNEVRSSLSLISTNVSTISRFSNQLTVNLPNTAEIREVREEIESKAEEQLRRPEKKDELEQLLQREDPALALAYTRIEIERLLRKILHKRLSSSPQDLETMRFTTLPRLVGKFLGLYPEYGYLEEAFSYVIRICSAAIHGQNVDQDQALEAADLGSRIILVLQTRVEVEAVTS